MDDVILNKSNTVLRCIDRVKEEYEKSGNDFLIDYSRQDASILNIQRAVKACIDISNRLVKLNKLGVTKSARESFELLKNKQIISEDISVKMQKMIGFRNIAVHDYQMINVNILVSVIQKHLVDFEVFLREVNS